MYLINWPLSGKHKEFERCRSLPGRKRLVTDAAELHYGIQCFDPYKGIKVGVSASSTANCDHSSFICLL